MMNKRNFQWSFGNGLGLNFNDPNNQQSVSSPPIQQNGDIFTLEGCASVCDPDTGELVFSTDGIDIFDSTGNQVFSNPNQKLKGDPSATTSAIISPVPGSSTKFYIITPGEVSGISAVRRLNNNFIDAGQSVTFSAISKRGIHFFLLDTSTSTSNWTLNEITSSVGNLFLDDMGSQIIVDITQSITEKLCLVANNTCDGYWLLTAWGNIIVTYKIDALGIHPNTYYRTQDIISPVGYLKVSHDGTMLGVANTETVNHPQNKNSLLLYGFDSARGVVSELDVSKSNLPTNVYESNQVKPLINGRFCYGIEFSPDNKLMYCSFPSPNDTDSSAANNGVVLQIRIADGRVMEVSNNFSLNQTPNPTLLPLNRASLGTSLGVSIPRRPLPHIAISAGALLLGPDGVIYLARGGSSSVAAITQPNEVEDGTNKCGLNNNYLDFSDQNNPHKISFAGLPSLVQNVNCDATTPGSTCEDKNIEVDNILAERCKEKSHTLEHCNMENACECDPSTLCEPVSLPEFKPCISIRWGKSPCDGIETDDVEIMCITVCNCHSNISFSNFSIASLTVVDTDGNMVALLPDGTPSVEVIPIGPYHFGKIEACSCVSREFVFRTRGAMSGPYHIKLGGICYTVCLHYDMEDCFIVDMCAD